MEIGVDSFVENTPLPDNSETLAPSERVRNLLEEIEVADDAFRTIHSRPT